MKLITLETDLLGARSALASATQSLFFAARCRQLTNRDVAELIDVQTMLYEAHQRLEKLLSKRGRR